MDVAKLDKMKVVERRAELAARGLDTKGVKAVLVDRLKAAIEDGIQPRASLERESSLQPPGTPTPATPGRRARRTRSQTRSPSPPKKVENVLETLEEEPPAEEKLEKQSDPPDSSAEKTSEKLRQKKPL